jgi:hypothetical protein
MLFKMQGPRKIYLFEFQEAPHLLLPESEPGVGGVGHHDQQVLLSSVPQRRQVHILACGH